MAFKSLWLSASDTCHLRCTICPTLTFDSKDKSKFLSMPVVEKVLKFSPNLDNVDLTGWGETLLNRDIFEIITAFKSAGAKSVTFTTNGELMDEKACEKIMGTSVNAISVSVDTASDATYRKIKSSGGFQKVMNNIKHLARLRDNGKDPYISTSFIIMRSNLEEMTRFVEIMAEAGVDDVAFKQLSGVWSQAALEELVFKGFNTPQKVPEGVEELIEEALQKGKELEIPVKFYGNMEPKFLGPCGNGANFRPFISAQGDVHPCCVLAYPISRIGRDGTQFTTGIKTFGNVLDEGLDRIWAKWNYRKFRKVLSLKTPSYPAACRECMVRYSVF